MRYTPAPPNIARRLRTLKCHCGKKATHIHLVDAHANMEFLKRLTTDDDETFHGYPRTWAVALPACDYHNPCGYHFPIESAVSEWFDWLKHLHGKNWQGDRALRDLAGA